MTMWCVRGLGAFTTHSRRVTTVVALVARALETTARGTTATAAPAAAAAAGAPHGHDRRRGGGGGGSASATVLSSAPAEGHAHLDEVRSREDGSVSVCVA
jgi:hypothetical protein